MKNVLLLHSPNDYKILNKLGDIYASKNNVEDAKTAINFYSRSILIYPTPRAFFGILNCSKGSISEATKKLMLQAAGDKFSIHAHCNQKYKKLYIINHYDGTRKSFTYHSRSLQV